MPGGAVLEKDTVTIKAHIARKLIAMLEGQRLNDIPTNAGYIYPPNFDPWLALAFGACTPVHKFGIAHVEETARDSGVVHYFDHAVLEGVSFTGGDGLSLYYVPFSKRGTVFP
jgi:hypothetical protein